MTLHPLAYQREAERCSRLARLADAQQDYAQARRLERLAAELRAKGAVQ